MRIIIALALGLVIAFLAGAYFLVGPVSLCCCGYQLEVHVTSDRGGLSQVCFDFCGNAAEADESLHARTKQLGIGHALYTDNGRVQSYVGGQPMVFGVPYTTRVYPSGEAIEKHRYTRLVVVGQYLDGTRAGTIIDLDERESHLETYTVKVKLP